MASAKWKLDNLTAILDHNNLQNDDCVADEMPIEPVADKWRAFGWHVMEIDGHNMTEIVEALEDAKTFKGMPTVIIARTIKGKGVSFMENVVDWHGKAPCREEAEEALEEIRRCGCE
jgi:transketolase